MVLPGLWAHEPVINRAQWAQPQPVVLREPASLTCPGWGMEAEYHLIDLATGLSHGGFRSLEAARAYARGEALVAWDIFHGNVHIERHDPRTDRIC